MKIRQLLQPMALTLLVVVLIMVVSSRRAEQNSWDYISSDASAGYVSPGVPGPDNDTGIIAQTRVSPSPVVSPTPGPDADKPEIDVTGWEYLLVNGDHNIGSFSPDVVTVDGTAQYFDSRAASALEDFLQAARDAGFTPYINAAYRPYSAQEYLFNGKASQISWGGQYTYAQAVELAKAVVAYPGTSEHQSGLCADITDKYYSVYDLAQMDQEQLTWLREHCAEYGFILRYPTEKKAVTGWDEPWHFRYVGKVAAAYIMENGLCLEEFLALYSK